MTGPGVPGGYRTQKTLSPVASTCPPIISLPGQESRKLKCRSCSEKKSLESFYLDRTRSSGYSYRCRPCQSEYAHKLYLKKNPDAGRGPRRGPRGGRSVKQRASDLRAEIVREYGGRCVCCQETGAAFLTIDHIKNDGNTHRKELRNKGGDSFYRWLKANGFPKDDFQLLCMNCNFGKWRAGGVCPHPLKGPILAHRGAVMAFLTKNAPERSFSAEAVGA